MAEALRKLREWLQKAERGSIDWLYDYDSRDKKHKKLLLEQGFPTEEEILDAREDEDGQPLRESGEPWLVNEAGTSSDEEEDPEDTYVEHDPRAKLRSYRV